MHIGSGTPQPLISNEVGAPSTPESKLKQSPTNLTAAPVFAKIAEPKTPPASLSDRISTRLSGIWSRLNKLIGNIFSRLYGLTKTLSPELTKFTAHLAASGDTALSSFFSTEHNFEKEDITQLMSRSSLHTLESEIRKLPPETQKEVYAHLHIEFHDQDPAQENEFQQLPQEQKDIMDEMYHPTGISIQYLKNKSHLDEINDTLELKVPPFNEQTESLAQFKERIQATLKNAANLLTPSQKEDLKRLAENGNIFAKECLTPEASEAAPETQLKRTRPIKQSAIVTSLAQFDEMQRKLLEKSRSIDRTTLETHPGETEELGTILLTLSLIINSHQLSQRTEGIDSIMRQARNLDLLKPYKEGKESLPDLKKRMILALKENVDPIIQEAIRTKLTEYVNNGDVYAQDWLDILNSHESS